MCLRCLSLCIARTRCVCNCYQVCYPTFRDQYAVQVYFDEYDVAVHTTLALSILSTGGKRKHKVRVNFPRRAATIEHGKSCHHYHCGTKTLEKSRWIVPIDSYTSLSKTSYYTNVATNATQHYPCQRLTPISRRREQGISAPSRRPVQLPD